MIKPQKRPETQNPKSHEVTIDSEQKVNKRTNLDQTNANRNPNLKQIIKTKTEQQQNIEKLRKEKTNPN